MIGQAYPVGAQKQRAQMLLALLPLLLMPSGSGGLGEGAKARFIQSISVEPIGLGLGARVKPLSALQAENQRGVAPAGSGKQCQYFPYTLTGHFLSGWGVGGALTGLHQQAATHTGT